MRTTINSVVPKSSRGERGRTRRAALKPRLTAGTGAAVRDLLKTLRECNAKAVPDGPWVDALLAVIYRVLALRGLDASGCELAVHAYLVGVVMGLYGPRSAIAEGWRIGLDAALARHCRYVRRLPDRLLRVLREAGEAQGRCFVAGSGQAWFAHGMRADAHHMKIRS